MDANAALCPVCRHEIVGLDVVRDHLRYVHGIAVTAVRPEGFLCQVCFHQLPSYRAWRRHTLERHLNQQQRIVDEGLLGNEGGANDQLNENDMVVHSDDSASDDGEMNDGRNDNDSASDDGQMHVDGSDSDTDVEEMNDDLNALENLPNGRKDIKHAAAKMIVDMRSVPAMTRVGVTRAMSGAELVLQVNNLSLRADVVNYLNRTGQRNHPRAANLLEKFNFASPFLGVKSNKGQISGVKKYYSYIEPQKCHIDDRLDQRLGDEGLYGLLPVPNSFQYASIIEFLKLVVRKPLVMDYVRNLRPSEDGMLYSYIDGDQYRAHPFFQLYPDAFQLVLYGDGVDPARSQGPKSGLHEIYHFVIDVLNLPPWLRFSEMCIFPIVMANALDCRGTFARVLHRFVDELLQLEQGVRVFVNGQFVVIRATLVAVKADSKAAHEILGFLGCGARHFCRQCMISRQELHRGEVAFGAKRTPEMSERQLERVAQNPAYSTQCGLKFRTCLHDSQYFRAENNNNFDLMHDGPLGVIIMLIRLCLKHFVCEEQLFTTEELNQRIFAFNYGKQNMKDRPTPNFSLDSLQNAHVVHKQKMNAGQVLVLMRALPFILDNLGEEAVNEDDDYLQILLLLSQVFQLASAHGIPRDEVPVLSRLLETFRHSWYILFPDVDPINRFHHLMHLSENTLLMGPQRQFWCFKEEGKNGHVKRHVSSCNNFINPNKTAMEQSQIYVSKVWGTQQDFIERRIFTRVQNVAVNALPVALQLQALGFGEEEQLRICKAVQVRNFEYRVGEFVLYGKPSQYADGLPRFGKIRSIICPDGSDLTWLALQHWENGGLVERFNAFVVRAVENAPTHLFDQADLPLHPPISRWRDYSTAESYLCLKFRVF